MALQALDLSVVRESFAIKDEQELARILGEIRAENPRVDDDLASVVREIGLYMRERGVEWRGTAEGIFDPGDPSYKDVILSVIVDEMSPDGCRELMKDLLIHLLKKDGASLDDVTVGVTRG